MRGSRSPTPADEVLMRCAACRVTDLPDDARFCPSCGAPTGRGPGTTAPDVETIVVPTVSVEATPPVRDSVWADPTPPVVPTVREPGDGPGTEPEVPADASPAPVRLDVAAARVYDAPTPPPGPDDSVATHLRRAVRRVLRGPLLLGATAGAAATALLMLLLAALLWQALPETNRSLLGIPSNLSELRGSLAVWATLHGIGGAAEGAGDTPLLGTILALAAAAAGGVAALEVLGRDRPARDRRVVGLLLGLPYAVIGLVLVALSRDGAWTPNAFAAVPACGLIGALGGLAGVEAWHSRDARREGSGGGRPAGLGSVARQTAQLLGVVLLATLAVGLLGNAVAIGSGEETNTRVGAWYAVLYAAEHAVSLLVLGLGALVERAGVLGLPLLLDRVEAVPREFRVTGLDVALPGLAYVGLVVLLGAAAYGLFVLAGYRAARSAGPAARVGPLLLRWAVVTGVLAAALLALVVLAYPVVGDDTTFGPRPASVLGWSLMGGGAAALVGLVLGAPEAVVRDAVRAAGGHAARLRAARRST